MLWLVPRVKLFGDWASHLFFLEDKAFEEAKPVIQAIKSKGITAIGAAGLCWGGKIHVFPCSCIFFMMASLPSLSYFN